MLRVTSRKVCHLGSLGATAGGGRLLYLETLAETKSGLCRRWNVHLTTHDLSIAVAVTPWRNNYETVEERIQLGDERNFLLVLCLRNSALPASDNFKLIITVDLHMNKAAVFVSSECFLLLLLLHSRMSQLKGGCPWGRAEDWSRAPSRQKKTCQNQACN